jgi:hypothetical protein
LVPGPKSSSIQCTWTRVEHEFWENSPCGAGKVRKLPRGDSTEFLFSRNNTKTRNRQQVEKSRGVTEKRQQVKYRKVW